jgi:ethanolamine utilization protein EutA
MDIGGGTSNLALCRDGKISAVGCLNVGGRLVKLKENGEITYISPVLQGYIPEKVGDVLTEERGTEIARLLSSVLEMAAGYRQKNELFGHFTTGGTSAVPVEPGVTVSFSGGVADCVEKEVSWLAYGDLGPLLGRAIRQSALCAGPYRLGTQTIRATVIGAGCHSTQLSGSTIFLQNAPLPMQNLPVAVLTTAQQELPAEELTGLIRRKMESLETWGVLHLPGWNAPDYGQVKALGAAIAKALEGKPCYIALEADMAKALGNAIALHTGRDAQILCIDGISATEQSYLDIGMPVGPALTVAVKTLVFDK